MLQVQTNPIAELSYDTLLYCNCYTKILDMSKGINSIISYSTALEVAIDLAIDFTLNYPLL